MDLGLKGQVAVVVGSASGIGRAIAEAFAAEGVTVVLVDRATTVTETAEQLAQRFGVQTLGMVADVTDYAAMQGAAMMSDQAFGGADHMVYAAGMGSGKGGMPFWNMTPEDWPRVLDVNLQGVVNTAHAFAPGFVERQRGSWLIIASVAGQIGSQTDPPYSAAKAGMINFAQCAAKDLAPYNVRCNVLNPGMVITPLNRGVWEAQMQNLPAAQRVDYETWGAEKIARIVPLNRWQTPEDMAMMTVFLASDRAKNVTGQCVNVDGGQVMHW